MKPVRAALFLSLAVLAPPGALLAQVPGGSLDPRAIPKFTAPLVVPPVMPRAGTIVIGDEGHETFLPGMDDKKTKKKLKIDYYEIAVRQFRQQVLPDGFPETTVWGYGAVSRPGTVAEGGSFHYPSFTIEARWRRPVRVKWINGLVDESGRFLPHLLPVDQTLHWANPPGTCADGSRGTDCRGLDPSPYEGPVPMVVHVHGAKTHDWSDGYPEAWYLPDATDIPGDFFRGGTYYERFKAASPLGALWERGSAVFEYPNDMAATTLWYHDHTLGMTRQNVYAGPAGFYILRGGPGDKVGGKLPGPAPKPRDKPGKRYREIPIVIQDRSFESDGSLFYPEDRAFFEGLAKDQLQIPFIPDETLSGEPSDVPPIWNPEFFGNTIVVNGRTWPYLEVEQRRYRFRLLNGCNARFLVLRLDGGLPFWQIGAEGGFLPRPLRLDELLIAPAERADVIVDFSGVPVGSEIVLRNLGPDEPYKGGVPGIDFPPADPATTGQVMLFRVVPRSGEDESTPPDRLRLPQPPSLGDATVRRTLTLNEEDSATVYVIEDAEGNIVEVPADTPGAAPFGPVAALLGAVDAEGVNHPLRWDDTITERPEVGATELWEIRNLTADAHPIHIHLVQFRVVEREDVLTGEIRPAEPWEAGYKDTVIAYPGQVTRVKARFDVAGLFVWHCHILEHEDNEMMRPFCVGGAEACPP